MAAKERLHELIAANAPVFYLHHDERFMPCSVEWFMQHSELRQYPQGTDGSNPAFKVLLERGHVNAAALAAAQAKHGGELQLSLDEQGRCGYPQDLINDVPLYVNAKEVVDSAGRTEALELNYLTFYAHNGPYTVAGVKTGAHDGDWEHITVRLDAETGRTVGVYFHAHRNHDGVWLSAAELPRCRDGSGRFAAFAALHGHGTYPSAGRQLRAMLCANDHCSETGPVWRPRRCFLLPHLPDAAPSELPPPPHPSGRPLLRVPSRGSCLQVPMPLPPPAQHKHRGPADALHNAMANGKAHMPRRRSTEQSIVSIMARHMDETETQRSVDGGIGGGAPNAAAAPDMAAAAAGSPTRLGGVEVVEGPAEWLRFRGRWGSAGGGTPSPITQRWFLQAEPPVSRTLFRRVLHFLP